jgi:hypothetical protein
VVALRELFFNEVSVELEFSNKRKGYCLTICAYEILGTVEICHTGFLSPAIMGCSP